MEHRVAELRQEHETRLTAFALEHADPAPEIEKLEAEIGRMVSALAAGVSSADVVATINATRARVEELRGRVIPEMPAWMALDRADLLAGVRTAGGTWMVAPLLSESDRGLAARRLGSWAWTGLP
jgi:hypothetical protein